MEFPPQTLPSFLTSLVIRLRISVQFGAQVCGQFSFDYYPLNEEMEKQNKTRKEKKKKQKKRKTIIPVTPLLD